MQISAGQDGIQRLLKAEQEAQKIVTEARKGTADLKCTPKKSATAVFYETNRCQVGDEMTQDL